MAEFSLKDLEQVSGITLRHYEENAALFWEATRDHDVTQNYQALLEALPNKKGLKILDFGCGPGRDLYSFKQMGHEPTGLDGCQEFCKMASAYSQCPVLHQDFRNLNLTPESFDGVFANASLFHVPRLELTKVLKQLHASLKPNGILFSSNPRGTGESFSDGRYANYMEFEDYSQFLKAAGFAILKHYYRPKDKPFAEQHWLAVVSKK